MRPLSLGLAFALPLLAACSQSAPASEEPSEEPVAAKEAVAVVSREPQTKAGEYRFHAARGMGVRFPVRRAGITVEERHFDPTLPEHKFRHLTHLMTERGAVVTIEAWDNPRRLELRAWFDENLGFLVDAAARVSERPMTRSQVPGILVDNPASSQAPGQLNAVFALGDQMFLVSGIDPENNGTDAFERVVDQIELDGTR